MSSVNGLDLALNVVENAGGHLLSTSEEGESVVHSLKVMGVAGFVLLAGPAEPGDGGDCWLGCQVGPLPISGRLVDVLAADPALTHRLDGEVAGEEVNLRLRTVIDPQELSVAAVRRITTDNSRHVTRLRSIVRADDGPADSDQETEAHYALFHPLLTSVVEECRRILRHGGHHTTLGLSADGTWPPGSDTIESVAVTRAGWLHLAAQPWTLRTSDDVRDLAAWLEDTTPPDTLAIHARDGHVRAAGATGAIAYAVEDDLDLTRAVSRALGHDIPPTLLDVLGGWLNTARKIRPVVEPASRPHDAGWQRPVTVFASSRNAEAEIRVLDPGTGLLVVHPGLSAILADLASGVRHDDQHAAVYHFLKEWIGDPRHLWNR